MSHVSLESCLTALRTVRDTVRDTLGDTPPAALLSVVATVAAAGAKPQKSSTHPQKSPSISKRAL